MLIICRSRSIECDIQACAKQVCEKTKFVPNSMNRQLADYVLFT